ncbi:hypothetical protein GGE16_001415 [Rhizobium leguminosarum]|uniref:Uncharacterized protein n=1 Tax=Rhizobium leguminosarum TaxID=384 RepID=A0AAE2MHR7_RHILE|nr:MULTISPECIES: hypothetical protein [Rhizobium]MBB4289399.1 hypothetical protein [Rhizobium leguminosarum]MBB4294506.1 hypothetical protein [Rhizobium leguminosarum]MBB4305901.1 hypothetical protein [Rhizobium leguminosarum]MBB4418521.1 hypothetical protein [Rhizobium leguminosarum]MBB4433366.1 hypothetical protein [Rhizobium esperanzae]
MGLVKSVLFGKEALSFAEKQALIAAKRHRRGIVSVGLPALLKP